MVKVTSITAVEVKALFVAKGNNPKAIKLASFQSVMDTLDDDECLTVEYISSGNALAAPAPVPPSALASASTSTSASASASAPAPALASANPRLKRPTPKII